MPLMGMYAAISAKFKVNTHTSADMIRYDMSSGAVKSLDLGDYNILKAFTRPGFSKDASRSNE